MCFTDPSPGFLSTDTVDILCRVIFHPVLCRMFNIILGLYPPNARSICPVVAVRDVLTLPLVPWEARSPLAEKHCLIAVVLPLLLLEADPAVTARKPVQPGHVGRPSRRNV